jgi:hypothetical protein
MLLNSRQRGRMTGGSLLEIRPLETQSLENQPPLQPVQPLVQPLAPLDQLFWNNLPVQGILMRGIKKEPEPLQKSPSSRICVFGCMKNGIHRWLTGTRYPPSLASLIVDTS